MDAVGGPRRRDGRTASLVPTTHAQRALLVATVRRGARPWGWSCGSCPSLVAALVFGGDSVFVDQGRFFGARRSSTFGGAYAVLSYVAKRAVEVYGWLAPGEMVRGLAMAETTPGPLIMVVQFVASWAPTATRAT